MKNSNTKNSKIFEHILFSPDHNEQIVTIICQALTSCLPSTYYRINKILTSLITNQKKDLKKECYRGLPYDLPPLRALVWKVNFKYLPSDIKKWDITLKSMRKQYKEIKDAFLLRKKEEMKIFEEIEKNNNKNLLLLAQSTDRMLLETISKDINRTHVYFNFFSKTVDHKIHLTQNQINEMLSSKTNCVYQDYKEVYTKDRIETHSDVLERILYIYAKMNKDIGYVQGMNEILAPIYYCYSLDNTCDLENVEADTFWSFSSLMDDIRDIYIKQNDNEKGGIFDKINLLELMISKIQKDIFNIFKKKNVNFWHFAYRWIHLFFSQQFILPDLLRIWDTIFCEEDRFYFVYLFSLGILEYKKRDLLEKNFYEVIEELQSKKITEIDKVIGYAFNIKKNYEKTINEILFFSGYKVNYIENVIINHKSNKMINEKIFNNIEEKKDKKNLKKKRNFFFKENNKVDDMTYKTTTSIPHHFHLFGKQDES